MNGMVERELKLEVPDRFSLARMEPQLDGYVASAVRFQRLHTVYYDTPDLRLTRWGCSLRFRLGEGWTLKIPVPRRSVGLVLEEQVFPGDARTIPPAAMDLATAYLRGVTPIPVAELRTLRTSRHMLTDAGDDLAEVVEDDVRVVDGTHVVDRFRQLEIELAQTAPDELLSVFKRAFREEGAGKPDPVPKNVRALGGAAGAAEIDVTVPRRDARGGELVRGALASSVERFMRHDSRLRLDPDAQTVHQARVAIRRLRSDLRSFLPLLDADWVRELRTRLRWPQDVLSAARDADVILENLGHASIALPDVDRPRIDDVLAPLRAARERAYEGVRTMLHDPRYVPMLCALVDAVKRPPLNELADEPGRDAIAVVLSDGWKKLRRRVRERSQIPSDRELHGIRIATKRVRYAAEALVPVAGRCAERLGRDAEELQTVLGAQHDAVMACERLRALGVDAELAFVAGELAAVAHATERDARRNWRDAWRASKNAYRSLRSSR
jgi:CHAD domain-containing protein